MRLTIQDIFHIQNRHQSAALLKAWVENAKSSGLHHQEPLGWGVTLVREPNLQRYPGRVQQPDPGRQSQCPGISHYQELHQHGISGLEEAGSEDNHLKCRGTKLGQRYGHHI